MDCCFTLKSSFGAWCNILFASRFQRRGQQKRGSKDPKPKFVASLDSSWIKVDECPLPQLSLDTFGLNWPSRWSFWSLEFEKFKGAWTLSFAAISRLPSPRCLGDDNDDDLEYAEERLEDDEELKLIAISDHGSFKKTLGSSWF